MRPMQTMTLPSRQSTHLGRPRLGMLSLFSGLILLGAAACDESTTPIPSGQGGADGEGGAAGEAGATAEAGSAGSAGAAGAAGSGEPDLSDPGDCTMSETWVGSIDAPSPLISVNKPVAVSHPDDITNPDIVVDGLYRTSNACIVYGATETDPRWIAFDLSEESATRLLLVWNDRGTQAYNDLRGSAPLDYRIELSSDSTDGSDGTWTTAENADGPVEVTGNPVRARGHSFDFDGMGWVRLVLNAPQPAADGADPRFIAFDEISIYDISASGSERPQDTWLFMGDSIAQGAFMRNIGEESFFETVVSAEASRFTPVVISAGIGGEFASHGVQHIELWLELNPDFTHIGVNYGTNDSWGKSEAAAGTFETNLRTLIEAIQAAGRVAHLSRVLYASDGAHGSVPAFNDVIDALTLEYDLPCGPDLYTTFYEPEGELRLGPDGVHPTPQGYRAMNRAWADAALPLYAAD